VCGHDLGALACLDLAARRPELVAGAVLLEAPMLWLVAAGTDAVADLREAVASAARDDGAAGAVRAYLEAVGGPGVGDLLGRERVDTALSNPRAFAADLAAAASWSAGRRELRALEAPLVLVSGTRSAAVRQEASRALDGLLPNSRLIRLDSGYFAHLERAEAVAAAIAESGV
jgi:pimeloyl-ACP methyl ester carboxylesterase